LSAYPDRVHAVVIGAAGYVGGELLRLIKAHPHFQLSAAVSESRSGQTIATVFPHLAGAYAAMEFAKPLTWTERLDKGANVALFSAAPHGASAAAVAAALEASAARDLSVRVVDCSADFRYDDPDRYREVYGKPHGAPTLLRDFYCAVPEHSTAACAKHIGHPGCFATAVLLAAVPLVRTGFAADRLFVTGITGSTGSGSSPQVGTHHPERHSNLYAYKPLTHRHTPEIERLIDAACGRQVAVNFVPQSGPYSRGIYAIVQADLEPHTTAEAVRPAFVSYYADAAFVHIVDGAPKLKDVVASNYCRIGIETTDDSVAVMVAIDNLVKGAAGGAMQWMNRLWSLSDTSGLEAPSPAWT
jgi:N-acetyl-gamma-glutamyl-phosphate reductase common form